MSGKPVTHLLFTGTRAKTTRLGIQLWSLGVMTLVPFSFLILFISQETSKPLKAVPYCAWISPLGPRWLLMDFQEPEAECSPCRCRILFCLLLRKLSQLRLLNTYPAASQTSWHQILCPHELGPLGGSESANSWRREYRDLQSITLLSVSSYLPNTLFMSFFLFVFYQLWFNKIYVFGLYLLLDTGLLKPLGFPEE